MKTPNVFFWLLILISCLFIQCVKKATENNSDINKEIIQEEKNNFEVVYKNLVVEFKPETITEEEFLNFKKKSNYIKVIEDYDTKNSIELFGGKEYEENISYYPLPIKINEQEYANNSIIFGDLNEDHKRDCIISVFRSDGYNEVTFFYVFINQGTNFVLEDVTNETEICGCKREGWPNAFRYQKIEDGFLKGVSMCHHKDAHCCPSLYLKTKVKFRQGKLQFDSTEFVMDDAIEYRPTPHMDSIVFKEIDLRK
ncbi:hypothetical protein K8354_13085 [Polaribacter litorisediminis]|uniref:hypothetical protein n=1 Tax=Polaribacter litorisediminis TaxID=1908341 RepID=UPI001CBE2D1D|nr:hypothetical protein [Polaribacter litorisediminis]UAM97247.1 hypothetical protein K8354_13085 [Polaribacter litorisediminis]